jgi:hypothetical protein
MFLNLFLHGAEAFKEYYSDTEHLLLHALLVPGARRRAPDARPLRVGRGRPQPAGVRPVHRPGARRNLVTLNIGCVATYIGCYIEKGMGLIIPGLTPDTLGEIYEYTPSLIELRVAAGIFASGFLITLGELQDQVVALAAPAHAAPVATRGSLEPVHADAEGRRADLAQRGRVPGPLICAAARDLDLPLISRDGDIRGSGVVRVLW